MFSSYDNYGEITKWRAFVAGVDRIAGLEPRSGGFQYGQHAFDDPVLIHQDLRSLHDHVPVKCAFLS